MSLEDEKDDSSYMCIVNLSQLSKNCKSVLLFFYFVFNPKCIERVSVFKKKQKEKTKTKNNDSKIKVNGCF